jgi:hypothetical protein
MTRLSPRPAAESAAGRRQRMWAAVVLAVLAPFTVDVLFGGTSVTDFSGVLSEISTYGFAAVLIRAVVRRRVLGFSSIVLFGLAFALTTEFLIVQTSLAPLGSLVPYPDYGRAMGVNWPFLVWALGYETLWGIAMPIALTELAFPLHRTSAWLGVRGCLVLTLLFVLGAAAAWYNWTQLTSPDYVHLPVYLPPLLTVLCGWVVVLMFVIAGLLLRPVQRRARRGGVPADSGPVAPGPWVVGIAAGGATFLWFALTVLWPLSGAWARSVPAFVPLLLAVILAGAAVVVLGGWTRRPGWSDAHRLGMVSGALLTSMAVGFGSNDLPDPVSLIGKIVLNVVAVVALVVLARKVRRRTASTAE